LLHDVIDRRSANACNGAPCATEHSGAAAPWRLDGNKGQFYLVDQPWQQVDDERIELPGSSILDAFKTFANRNGDLGTRLSFDSLLPYLADRMYESGYSQADVCELIKLHRGDGSCPGSWVPAPPPPVILY